MDAIERILAFDDPMRFRAPADAVRWGVAGSVGTLVAVGLLLLMRRVVGAVTADLPPLHLFTTAIVAGVVVVGGRVVWRRWALSRPSAVSSGPNGERRDVKSERLIGWGGSAGMVLLALGCSLGRAGDWLLWLPLIAADQWQLRWFLRSRESRVEGRGPDSSLDSRLSALDSRPSSFPPLAPPFEGGGLQLQRLIRVRDADGGEAIHGMLRAEFVAGQRQATLHVGFCPPLERAPVVEVEAGDGPDAEVKVAQAFAHGARLEVRLASVAEEDCRVIVELSAKAAALSEIGRG